MKIRKYKKEYCGQILELFYQTVHSVNSKDYSEEELDVWATGSEDEEKWHFSLSKNYCLVALEGEKIIGFGDISSSGYLDRLYVDKNFQRKGVATAICDLLEKESDGTIKTQSSITAKDFFIKRGYQVVKEQKVVRSGIFLKNFIMLKQK